MKKKNAVNLVKTLMSTVAIWLCLISVNSFAVDEINTCPLYTSEAAHEEDSVARGGRRNIYKKTSNCISYANLVEVTNIQL